MATITSINSGNWSSPSTWSGNVVPVDGDSVVIANLTSVVFDVDTWETDTFEWTNTANYDVAIDVTFAGMNATGYVYGYVEDVFAGGGISRARVLGGV